MKLSPIMFINDSPAMSQWPPLGAVRRFGAGFSVVSGCVKRARSVAGSLVLGSLLVSGFFSQAKALCIGICPGPYRPLYAPYPYRRPVYIPPVRAVPAPAAPIVSDPDVKVVCSNSARTADVFFAPNYSSSVVAVLPIGSRVVVTGYVVKDREQWVSVTFAENRGYIHSSKIC